MSKKDEQGQVDTGGGAYVGGNVEVGRGSFVGRDQIRVGDVSGTGIAIGTGARATVSQDAAGDTITQVFVSVYETIAARAEDPDVDKAEITETVQKIEQEAAKGEEANPNKIARWFKTLGTMAPDILEVAAACLANPVTGVATVVRKIAQKAQQEATASTP